MNQTLNQARRVITAFVALIAGRTTRVHWDGVGSIDRRGEIHLPTPQSGDAAEIALLTRLAVHEAGHLLETQEGWADRLTQEEQTIFNVLEDPRMEGRQVQRFPGAAVVLSRGLDEALQTIADKLDPLGNAKPPRALQLDMLMRGFLAVAPHGPIARRAPQILDKIAPQISDDERAAIDEAVAKLPGFKTSLEAEEAARAFVARLRETKPPPMNGPEQGDQSDETSKEQEGDAQGPRDEQRESRRALDAGAQQSEDNSAKDPGGDSAAEPSPDPAASADGNEAQQGDGGGEASASPADSQVGASDSDASDSTSGTDPFDLGHLLREAHVARYGEAQANPVAAVDDRDSAPSDAELERVAALLEQADPLMKLEELVAASLAALAAGDLSESGEAIRGAGLSLAALPGSPADLIETRLQGVQSRLVTVLQREFQDKRHRLTRAAYAGGRVMPQRFWRLGALGDAKVFAQRRPVTGIEAAATVLLDSSDSMQAQLNAAAQVTVAFSLALQRLGIRTRVARFPGMETVTETIQRFGESARHCAQRCAELTASGGTPIGAAVAHETPALLEQRKLKNVLIVITDDQPGDKMTLLAALEHAAQLDILIVGIGIGCDIRRWIAHSVSVQDVNELPDALARLFRDNIKEKLLA
jgi:cobalamin biosynthesis protein CobT